MYKAHVRDLRKSIQDERDRADDAWNRFWILHDSNRAKEDFNDLSEED